MDTAAIVSAIVAIVAAASAGISFWRLRSERRQWELEFVARQADYRAGFLRDLQARRYAAYPRVLRFLGDVRDTDRRQREQLSADPGRLEATHEGLMEELYGEAGLLMEWETRNSILAACWACRAFDDGKLEMPDLIEAFYVARRALRHDLLVPIDPIVADAVKNVRRNMLEPQPPTAPEEGLPGEFS